MAQGGNVLIAGVASMLSMLENGIAIVSSYGFGSGLLRTVRHDDAAAQDNAIEERPSNLIAGNVRIASGDLVK